MAKIYSVRDSVGEPVEIIEDRLYFLSTRTVPQSCPGVSHFGVDNDLVYYRFFNDFGPLNIGQTFKFCWMLKQKMAEACDRKVYYYCSADPQRRANAACLIGAFLVLMLDYEADDAYRPLSMCYPPFIPFRDASTGPSCFHLTVYDCLRALHKAKSNGWINMKTFNVHEYEYYEKLEHGDLNWIIPNKFLALSGPQGLSAVSSRGSRAHPPEFYIPIFQKLEITTVVRLNRKCYDQNKFTDSGIHHFDLYFPDGSCPSDSIIKRFLDIADKGVGAIAVHCKAGLGRTGTLIACYIMKNYRFSAAEAIGWLRLCRPAMVIGPQQTFLRSIESRLWRKGEAEGRFAIPSELREGDTGVLEVIEDRKMFQASEVHPQKISRAHVKLPMFKSNHANSNQPVRGSASMSEFSSKKEDARMDNLSRNRQSSKTPTDASRSLHQIEETNMDKPTNSRKPPQLNKHFLDSPYCAETSTAPSVRPINRTPLAPRKGSVPVRQRPRDIGSISHD